MQRNYFKWLNKALEFNLCTPLLSCKLSRPRIVQNDYCWFRRGIYYCLKIHIWLSATSLSHSSLFPSPLFIQHILSPFLVNYFFSSTKTLVVKFAYTPWTVQQILGRDGKYPLCFFLAVSQPFALLVLFHGHMIFILTLSILLT